MITKNSASCQLQETLEKVFGFTTFRPGQKEAIETLLEKKRLLCIQPTGHGKSLLYQLPAYLLGDITVVISPLLALMRDQTEQLQRRFNLSAASINSDQTDEENEISRQAVLRGLVRVLFIAPEQLDHVDRFQFLLNLPIQLIVVDEAHCISTWGHDFRPSYRQILHFINALQNHNPEVRVLALTATADDRVEKDIKKQLSFQAHAVTVLRESMNRPNLQLQVIKAKSTAEKLALCELLVQQQTGCGLIYCATRENTELVAEYLKLKGMNVAAYHAGFSPESKRQLQQEFIQDTYKALCATNALGMGIDKSNVRFIIHFDIPGSITAYYQEVGRAGRDGNNANGILLYEPRDIRIQEHFINASLPDLDDFEKVLQVVRSQQAHPNLTTIKQETGLHPTKVTVCIAELVEQGYLVKISQQGKQVYKAESKQTAPDLTRYTRQYEVKTKELQALLEYATHNKTCRMAILRHALGDDHTTSCGHCDVCQPKKLVHPTQEAVDPIATWLDLRPVPISAMTQQKISDGCSLFDGKLRAPLFVEFMKERSEKTTINEELADKLKNCLTSLSRRYAFSGIVMLPTKTWAARQAFGTLIAEHLSLPLFSDLLVWQEVPQCRQGELLNNDQRHYNVHQRMGINPCVKVPPGTLLLVDDYIGSGATMREAGRTLRATKKVSGELVPLTIASLKWHLGKRGFV